MPEHFLNHSAFWVFGCVFSVVLFVNEWGVDYRSIASPRSSAGYEATICVTHSSTAAYGGPWTGRYKDLGVRDSFLTKVFQLRLNITGPGKSAAEDNCLYGVLGSQYRISRISWTYSDRMLILGLSSLRLFFDESDDIFNHRTEHFD